MDIFRSPQALVWGDIFPDKMYRRLATIGKTACRFVFITLQRLVLDSIVYIEFAYFSPKSGKHMKQMFNPPLRGDVGVKK